MRRLLRLLFIPLVLLPALEFSARAYQQQTADQIRIQQAQQAAAQAAAEAERRRQEAERKAMMDSIMSVAPVNLSRSAPRQNIEPCISLIKERGPAVDPREIPVTEWIAAGEIAEIPWKVQFQKPQLRIDQRYELAYSARVDGKHLGWKAGKHELIYMFGVRRADGQWAVPPRLSRQVFNSVPQTNFRAILSDCVFLQPGEYVMWIAIYDRESGRRSVAQKRVRPPEFESDALPKLNSRLPAAEFPIVNGGSRLAIEVSPGQMLLPIANKRPIAVELISLLSPADQWAGRADLIRWENNRVLGATSILAQMKPANGSVSLAAVDLVNRAIPFHEPQFRQFNWSSLASQFTQVTADHKVTLPALDALKKRSGFLREFLLERLDVPGEPVRVLILVSGSLLFERGSDLSSVKWEGDCNCRIYHLRFRLNKDDVFDDLEKLIKSLRPTKFDIDSPKEFREVLGKIVQDLEGL